MFFKKKIKKKTYDKLTQRPIIRCSICTGEQVAGFKDIYSGKFQEIMLIRDRKDMDNFLSIYDLDIQELTKEY